MIMSYEGYQEALESEKKKEGELEAMKEQFRSMQSQIQSLIMAFANMKEQNQFDSMAKTLYDSHILGKEATTALPSPTSKPTSTTPSMTTGNTERFFRGRNRRSIATTRTKAKAHTKTTHKGTAGRARFMQLRERKEGKAEEDQLLQDKVGNKCMIE